MGRVSKLAAALGAREATEVVVDEHVVVEAVLARERATAQQTHVRLDARVAAVVLQQRGGRRDHPLADLARQELLRSVLLDLVLAQLRHVS